jgi:hypothetical protein
MSLESKRDQLISGNPAQAEILPREGFSNQQKQARLGALAGSVTKVEAQL